ncbi:MAG: hypothetical protein REI94_10215 [Moraxellaceae bacterium]|nr:hypothetical protein [Moraxellaceae bacterium]
MTKAIGGDNVVSIGARTQARDVGVVVNGSATFGRAGEHVSESLLDGELFKKMTGIEASPAARLALMQLLEEDISLQEVRGVWGDELHFHDERLFVYPHENAAWIIAGSTALWLTTLWCLVAAITLGELVFPTCALFAMASIQFTYLVLTECRQLFICRRLKPMVARVNKELPRLLKAWHDDRSFHHA